MLCEYCDKHNALNVTQNLLSACTSMHHSAPVKEKMATHAALMRTKMKTKQNKKYNKIKLKHTKTKPITKQRVPNVKCASCTKKKYNERQSCLYTNEFQWEKKFQCW